MVIALIPVPAVVRHLNQQVESQRLAAVDAQVLVKIGVHLRLRRGMRIGVSAKVNNLRLRQGSTLVHPLPDLAVVLGKPRTQGVGLHHARHHRFRQQRRINRADQLDVMGHAPGVGQVGKLFRHPDPRLGGHERKLCAHGVTCAKWAGIRVCHWAASHC